MLDNAALSGQSTLPEDVTARQSACSFDQRNSTFLVIQEAQKSAAHFQLYLSLSMSIPAALIAVVAGTYSDQVGRRLLFVAGNTGVIMLSSGYSVIIYWKLSVNYLLIVHAIASSTGLQLLIYLAGFSYTADVTSKDKTRTYQMNKLEAFICLSKGFSILSVGVMIKHWGFFYPNLFSLGLGLLNFPLILLLKEESPRPSDVLCGSISQNLKRLLAFYTSTRKNNPRSYYIITIIIVFLLSFVAAGLPGVETLYQLNKPLCWDSVNIGTYEAFISVTHGVIGAVLTKCLQTFLDDTAIAIIASMSWLMSLMIEGFAVTSGLMYLVALSGMTRLYLFAMTKAIVSKLTPDSQYGAIFSSLICATALAGVLGPITVNALYAFLVHIYARAVFFILAGLAVVILILCIVVHWLIKGLKQDPERSSIINKTILE